MNAFSMIVGVLFAGTLLFAGASLQRYISYIRMMFVSLCVTLFVITYFWHPASFMNIVQSSYSTGMNQLWNLMTTLETTQKKLILIGIILIMSVLSWFFVHHVKIAADSVSIFALIFLMVFAIIWSIPLVGTLPIRIIGGVVAGIGALLLRKKESWKFHIVLSSIIGGSLIAICFTLFYFLPIWVCIMLALVSIILGLASQMHTYTKRLHKEDIATHE